MLKYVLKSVFPAVFLSGLLYSGVWGAVDLKLEEVRAELDSMRSVLQISVARRDSLRIQADQLAAEVDRLKKSLEKHDSRLDQNRLEEALSRSQALADSLDELNLDISLAGKKAARLRTQADSVYKERLDLLSLKLEKTTDSSQRREIFEEIEALRTARSSLAVLKTGEQEVKEDRESRNLSQLLEIARVSAEDSPEEITEKADFVGDMASRFKRMLVQVERNIKRISEESAVRQRLGEFAQEISLFDETLSWSRASVKSSGNAQDDQRNEGVLVERTPEEKNFFSNETAFNGESDERTESYDLELRDLEAESWLGENLGNISGEELRAVLNQLEARRDSIKADLDLLRKVEREIRNRIEGSGSEQEDPPKK